MPRDGSNVYQKPFGTTAVAGETIESGDYNTAMDDIVADLNLPRPISAGGTGAATAELARAALDVEPLGPFLQSLKNTDAMTAGTERILSENADGDGGEWLDFQAVEVATALQAEAGTDAVAYMSPAMVTVQVEAMRPLGTGANQVLSLDGDAKIPAVDGSQLTGGVVVASRGDSVSTASGTEADILDVAADAQEITLAFAQVNMTGSDNFLIQLGTASAWITSGYDSDSTSAFGNATSSVSSSSGFIINPYSSVGDTSGHALLTKQTDVWVFSSQMTSGSDGIISGGVSGTIADPITRVRVTPTGASIFDGGEVLPTYKAWTA